MARLLNAKIFMCHHTNYTMSRRRSRKFTAPIALYLFYTAVFVAILPLATPLASWLARPLFVSDPLKKADAIVVLSAGISRSGTLRNGAIERLDHATELFKKGWAPRIVISGGPHRYGHIEADIMANYLYGRRVPPSDVIRERRSRRTYTNASETALNCSLSIATTSAASAWKSLSPTMCSAIRRNGGIMP